MRRRHARLTRMARLTRVHHHTRRPHSVAGASSSVCVAFFNPDRRDSTFVRRKRSGTSARNRIKLQPVPVVLYTRTSFYKNHKTDNFCVRGAVLTFPIFFFSWSTDFAIFWWFSFGPTTTCPTLTSSSANRFPNLLLPRPLNNQNAYLWSQIEMGSKSFFNQFFKAAESLKIPNV